MKRAASNVLYALSFVGLAYALYRVVPLVYQESGILAFIVAAALIISALEMVDTAIREYLTGRFWWSLPRVSDVS